MYNAVYMAFGHKDKTYMISNAAYELFVRYRKSDDDMLKVLHPIGRPGCNALAIVGNFGLAVYTDPQTEIKWVKTELEYHVCGMLPIVSPQRFHEAYDIGILGLTDIEGIVRRCDRLDGLNVWKMLIYRPVNRDMGQSSGWYIIEKAFDGYNIQNLGNMIEWKFSSLESILLLKATTYQIRAMTTMLHTAYLGTM